MAGAAPIDCDQPLNAHITAKEMKMTAVGMTLCINPNTPIRALAAAETISPVAIKRFMLQ